MIYRGYTIEKTGTTVSAGVGTLSGMQEGHTGYLLKITGPDGRALRDARGNLPLLTSWDAARARVDELHHD